MITIVLADDHPVVRRGLRAILEAESDLQVLGEATDGLEAVRLVERLRPHVAVLDVMMPGMSGLEATRQIVERASMTRIVLLSISASEGYVQEALRGGALAYVVKDASASDLVDAVRAASTGHRYLSPTLSARALDAYARRAQDREAAPHESLTSREREVLQFVAEGCTSFEIGERLRLSPRTVESHRANLLRKLGLRSQTDVVRYALRHGILPMD